MRLSKLFEDENITDEFILKNFRGKTWEAKHSFIEENWDIDLQDLTYEQEVYVREILAACIERKEDLR